MEQQALPSYNLSTKHRESRSVRPSSPALTSNLTTTPQSTTTNTTNQGTLSASEPTLRFPRPQGSRHLANWISTSTPDIMRITTTTEDTGLSESTYELVSGTDTESQDDNYTESMSDSIASLDFHRSDDVHSIADTEHTYDDESLVESEVLQQPGPDSHEEDQYDTTILDQAPAEKQQDDAQEDEDDTNSDDEERSRSSIEYTKQFLSTPSIPPTPEASGIVERPTAASGAGDDAGILKGNQSWVAKAKQNLVDIRSATSYIVPDVLAALVCAAIVIFGASFFASSGTKQLAPHIPAAPPAVFSSIISATVITTSKVSSTQRIITTTTTTTAAGLVPLENVLSDDWLFPSRKTELFMSKHNGDYLIHINPGIKYHCLSVVAHRGDDTVNMDISHVEEGLLLKFPYEESYGTVRVEVASRCRPKIKQVLEIPFGERGIMEEAVEKAMHFVHDVCERIPFAAQEAEKRFEETKRTLESASTNAIQASDHLYKDLIINLHRWHRFLGSTKIGFCENVKEMKEQLSKQANAAAGKVAQQLPDTRNIQEQAQLGLLDAQLSAKILWLKYTAQREKHEEYKRKASLFLGTKLAEVKRARQARLGLKKVDSESYMQPEIWSKIFREGRCRRTAKQGLRAPHQCEEIA